MQGLFTYIYHISLIIAFVRMIEICSHTYRATHEEWTNDCRWMFVFLLIESIGSFAFDMGYISDVTFGFGSILTLLKVTIDVIVYAFLSHLIYDYLDLPRDDSPFILLGIMYAAAALLVLLTGFRSYFSLGQSLLCIGPAYTSYKALRALSEKNISVPAQDSADETDIYTSDKTAGIIALLRMIIIFMILLTIQNFTVYFFNDNNWLGLRYVVNPVDDLFSLCLVFILQKIEQVTGRQAEAADVANTLEKEINSNTSIKGSERIIGRFCALHNMTGRESEITELILRGRTNQEISDELFISIGTVKRHIYNIYTKLEVERRSQLMSSYAEYERNHR